MSKTRTESKSGKQVTLPALFSKQSVLQSKYNKPLSSQKNKHTELEKKYSQLEQENIQLKKENDQLKRTNELLLKRTVQLIMAVAELKEDILNKTEFQDLISQAISQWGPELFVVPLPDNTWSSNKPSTKS